MSPIFVAVFLVTVTGAICAALLNIASKFMFVKTDERVERLLNCLPGMNCGACGFPGCSGYASALAEKSSLKSNLCTPGGPAVSLRLSAILGVDAEDVEEKKAIVHCRGDNSAQKKKAEYSGIQTCSAAKDLFSGEGACAFGCMGFGDCASHCPSHAICIENNLARINPLLCTGCGVCANTCPNKLISIVNTSDLVFILCSNLEKGAVARKKCSNACIACGKCVRECPSQGIALVDNLAVIDRDKCTGSLKNASEGIVSNDDTSDTSASPENNTCAHCAEICVAHCIKILPVSNLA